jgi:hypothetical protein
MLSAPSNCCSARVMAAALPVMARRSRQVFLSERRPVLAASGL